MRLKYYLRGLGIGILFATIILMISYHVVHNEKPMTDADIINRAKELGMVEGTQSSEKESQIQDSQSQETQMPETQISDTQSSENQISDDETSETYEPLVLNIEAGTTWSQTCQQMENAGLIASADELYRYYVSNFGTSGKTLKVGTYSIPYGSDFDTIISIFFPE